MELWLIATLLFSFEPTEGNVETFKEKVEVDDANKKVTLTALKGHCLDLYKTYKVIYQVVPKSEVGSVKVTIEYEKLNENVPPPTKYIDFIVNLLSFLACFTRVPPLATCQPRSSREALLSVHFWAFLRTFSHITLTWFPPKYKVSKCWISSKLTQNKANKMVD